MIRYILIFLLGTATFLNLYPVVEQYLADGYLVQRKLVLGIVSFAILFLLIEGKRYKQAFDDIDAQ